MGHPIVSALSLWSSYATSDGAIVLGGVDSKRFQGLCAVVELPELAAAYADEITRALNITRVREAISEKFRGRSTRYWLDALRSVDVIVAPVQSYDDIINDPQAWVNGYLTTLNHPVHGKVKVVGCPIQFGREPTEPQGPPPELGQDTETCLMELGYSWDEIEALRANEVT
ncbi:MAG: CoA transferase [Gammaproteobacteria bacterium]|nr:CoA transferase [Gammaproteobacteria bacterium]